MKISPHEPPRKLLKYDIVNTFYIFFPADQVLKEAGFKSDKLFPRKN